SPLDVSWRNMGLSAHEKKGRRMVTVAVATAMILLWTIPTIFVSSLASITDIVNAFSFLGFLQQLPPWLLGVVQGILPPLLLAGLMELLPILLIIMAMFEGHVRYSDMSLSV